MLKVVQIADQTVTLSGDGTARFSDPENWHECGTRYAQRREEAFTDVRKSVAKTSLVRDFTPSSFVDDEPSRELPERALWLAILERAILDARDLTRPHPHEDSGHIRAEALAWFRSRSTEPGSFIFCCEVLDVSPAVVLEKIKIVGQETADQSVYQSE